MKDLGILYPVCVQILLTFLLQGWMGHERRKAVLEGSVQRGTTPGANPVWPERATILSNAFQNQFEIPVLFYAVVAFALIVGAADATMVALAWVFAISRLIHAAIHTTYNRVPHRFLVYLLGSFAVMAMWAKLALSVLGGGTST